MLAGLDGSDTLDGRAGADTYAVDYGDIVTDFAAIDGAAFGTIEGELRWEMVGDNVLLLADLTVALNSMASDTGGGPDLVNRAKGGVILVFPVSGHWNFLFTCIFSFAHKKKIQNQRLMSEGL